VPTGRAIARFLAEPLSVLRDGAPNRNPSMTTPVMADEIIHHYCAVCHRFDGKMQRRLLL
jgi:hypothetical protein